MRTTRLVALAVGVALAAAGCGGGPVARVATAGGPSTAGRSASTTSAGATPFATFTASPIIVHPPVASPTSGTGAVLAGSGVATADTATTGGSAGPSSGGAPGGSGAPTPTLTPSSGTVVVTSGDEGSTVVLAPGDTLVVELSGDWVAPTASDNAVLRRDSVTKSDTSARATFTALTVGRSDVDSASDAPCLHASPPCEIPQRKWVVHVVVQE